MVMEQLSAAAGLCPKSSPWKQPASTLILQTEAFWENGTLTKVAASNCFA
ncbi:hypothetical protein EBBID32_41860 [Sphingobium indicum BiD32]|uniref:Uncharacterized protein n=1 Tax=Sphingobium indicum BiD32 TaxID=1301087 RepID=N1MS72_9SPHN|nr:hypothetical protein EBBID32_41860 [Sphingobium indicum BiD32]